MPLNKLELEARLGCSEGNHYCHDRETFIFVKRQIDVRNASCKPMSLTVTGEYIALSVDLVLIFIHQGFLI